MADAELRLALARNAITRVAHEEPNRPNWIGDRINAAVRRIDREYRFDLATAWPHLWLAMSDSTRTAINAARESLASAAVLVGWGLLYMAIGALWWPGLLAAAVVICTGRSRARVAADTYGLLLEAAARLYTGPLATSLGIDHTGHSTSEPDGRSPACSRAKPT